MAYFKSLDQAARSKSLNLKQSDLTSLPSEVISIRGLASLVLDENELVTLPEQVAQMKDLVTLSVKNNKLTSLPDTMSALVNLKELDLSENQLAELPIASMMQMHKLSSLNQPQSFPTIRYQNHQMVQQAKLLLEGPFSM